MHSGSWVDVGVITPLVLTPREERRRMLGLPRTDISTAVGH